MTITKIATLTQDRSAAFPNLTVPAGVTADHFGIIVATSSNAYSTGGTVNAPGWNHRWGPQIESGNAEVNFLTRLGGLTAGQTIPLTISNSSNFTVFAVWYDTQGRDISAFTYGGRAGTTQSTLKVSTATGLFLQYANQDVLLLATERSSTTSSSITGFSYNTQDPATNVALTFTQDWFVENTTSTAASFYAGHATGPATGNHTAQRAWLTYANSNTGTGTIFEIGFKDTPTPTLVRSQMGLPSDTSIRVKALTKWVTNARLLVWDNATSTMLNDNSFAVDAQGYTGVHVVSGLSPNTSYGWMWEFDGVQMSPVFQTTKTAPTAGTPTNAKIAFGSCQKIGGGYSAVADIPVYNSIAAQNPDLLLYIGDVHYNWRGDSPNGAAAPADAVQLRAAWEAGMQVPALATLMNQVPTYHTWSDNDFCGSNSDSTFTAASTAYTVHRQVFIGSGVGGDSSNNALYFTTMWGRFKIIVTDGRAYMSDKAATDDSSKTKLGATQKNWFKAQINDTAGCAAVLWFHEDAWHGGAATGSGIDGWQAYSTERQELADYITANISAPIYYFCGDTHTLEMDNGTGNAYGGFPTFDAAPFYQDAQVWPWSGTHSVGVYPTTTTGNLSNQSYYGTIEITDSAATGNWSIALKAYDATGITNGAPGTVRLQTTYTGHKTP
jgi:hypothetical protein